MMLRIYFSFSILICFPFFVNSETVHNCVKNGDRFDCSSQSREEANTPPTTYRLGSRAYCLVSKVPLTRYFCNYDTYDQCLAFANANNLGGTNNSSCIQNSVFRGYDRQNNENYPRNSRVENTQDNIAALLAAVEEKDYETALRLALNNQNDPYAQLILGAMYADGKGVAKDKKQAIKWMERAANNGVKEAQEFLEELRGGKRKAESFYYHKENFAPIYDGKNNEGESCIYQSECGSGLVCRYGECQFPQRN